ncbi:unnamed protein product [Arabidopsis lyrata]|nr:unnamed protein product [Arabidopsis lyrata]
MLEPHWCNNRLSGIALCAVVSFHQNQDPIIDSFSVKCTLHFENEDGSRIRFDCDVGSLPEPAGRLAADHVFIGYVSFSHFTKRLEDHYSGNSIPTKASLEFYLTDASNSEVVDCGLSLMYAEPDNIFVEENGHKTSVEANGHETFSLKGRIESSSSDRFIIGYASASVVPGM